MLIQKHSFSVTLSIFQKKGKEIKRSIFYNVFFLYLKDFQREKERKFKSLRFFRVWSILRERTSAKNHHKYSAIQICLEKHSRWLHPSSLGNVAEIINLCVMKKICNKEYFWSRASGWGKQNFFPLVSCTHWGPWRRYEIKCGPRSRCTFRQFSHREKSAQEERKKGRCESTTLSPR